MKHRTLADGVREHTVDVDEPGLAGGFDGRHVGLQEHRPALGEQALNVSANQVFVAVSVSGSVPSPSRH